MQKAAAQPAIHKVAPNGGGIGQVVTIEGQNFSANWYENRVYFGAVKATVDKNTATTTFLQVTVPAVLRMRRLACWLTT